MRNPVDCSEDFEQEWNYPNLISTNSAVLIKKKSFVVQAKNRLDRNRIPSKVVRARELLLTGDTDGTDYKEIKQDCERNISRSKHSLSMPIEKAILRNS